MLGWPPRTDQITRTGVVQPYPLRDTYPGDLARGALMPFLNAVRDLGPMLAETPTNQEIVEAAQQVAAELGKGRSVNVAFANETYLVGPNDTASPPGYAGKVVELARALVKGQSAVVEAGQGTAVVANSANPVPGAGTAMVGKIAPSIRGKGLGFAGGEPPAPYGLPAPPYAVQYTRALPSYSQGVVPGSDQAGRAAAQAMVDALLPSAAGPPSMTASDWAAGHVNGPPMALVSSLWGGRR